VKRDLSIALISSILVAGICYGLATIRPDFAPSASHAYSTATGPQPGSNEHVVMRVNGEPITETEFNAFIEQAPEDMRAYYASPAGRESLATELVKLKALEQEGRRLGIDKDPAVANRISLTRANIIAGYTLRKIVKPPNDARIREEWEKEKKNYDTVELRHIVVAHEGSRFRPRRGQPLALEQAMNKARGITARLRAGADFIKVAKSESDDQNTANNGGDLGPVGVGALPKELDQVAMKLKPGEVSDPVNSEYGIHIFKAGQHKTMKYDDQVKQGLSAVIERKDLQAMMSRLQKQAKVDLDPKFFGKASQPKRTGT